MGGQFVHRFTFQNPAMIEASAPLASGSWTTPDGGLLMPEFDEIEKLASFVTSRDNASTLREGHFLFKPRFAKAAGLSAQPGAERVPFLVMCGTLDPRLDTRQEFVGRLRTMGYSVETEWPRTPHGFDAYNLAPPSARIPLPPRSAKAGEVYRARDTKLARDVDRPRGLDADPTGSTTSSPDAPPKLRSLKIRS